MSCTSWFLSAGLIVAVTISELSVPRGYRGATTELTNTAVRIIVGVIRPGHATRFGGILHVTGFAGRAGKADFATL